ncbi:zinc finger protein 92-like [Corythoichthys intestinalis]|uniref:zinc finger protein 92-like n=1 Tax=Corythoichthys intestinalis TaxID=161448 RepID=UPI0025A5592D|nr:zinc finger protein 92-like [Corythoichthys intestinalis]XP_061814086.1 zinc finger protein 92-like [Nerophis lumbriciformis]
MPSVQLLRAFVSERLTVAVEEIMMIFEKTISEYEDELKHHRRLLEAGQMPRTTVDDHRTDTSRCIQPVVISMKIPLVHQERSQSLDQEAPTPSHFKQEVEEVWTSPVLKDCQKSEDLNLENEYAEEKPISFIKQQRESVEHRQANSSSCEPLASEFNDNVGGLNVSNVANVTNNSQPALLKLVNFNNRKQTTDNQPFSDSWKYNDPEPHLSAHNQRKCFKCSECGKIFKYSHNLQRHKSCHTGEKPFGCIECGRKFNQKASLNRHKRIHTGEKPFCCMFCGKNFTRRGSLTSHMRFHTGEKPFSCSVCKKSYNNREVLVKHMTTHENCM